MLLQDKSLLILSSCGHPALVPHSIAMPDSNLQAYNYTRADDQSAPSPLTASRLKAGLLGVLEKSSVQNPFPSIIACSIKESNEQPRWIPYFLPPQDILTG